MAVRVAINGLGRIGRTALRTAHERELDIDWAGLNDILDPELLAHLLRHDTIYGPFPGRIEVRGDELVVDGVPIPVFRETDPARLPWSSLGVEVVLEATGKFRTRDEAAKHLEAGARKVIISAPGKDVDATIVLGVNLDAYDPARHDVISMASCTTNCLAPVAKALSDELGIEHGLMTTIHAYTGDQRLTDAPHKDFRRARAAAANLIPTSTGAAKAIGLVVPQLAGRLHGFAVRVPVLTGSLVDLTVESFRTTTVDEVNAILRDRADGEILAYSDEPLVSSDIVRSPCSSIVDSQLTSVVDGTLVKVVSWYDNEWGYSNRLVELATQVLAPTFAGVR
jgi:glyceraldehyde 3-phosphate dehydrogenase (phosphorylating)